MPYGEIKLVPGLNVERTPTLLEAGVSDCRLIRYRDGLIQKYGGWQKFYQFSVSGTPRDLHAWQDLNSEDHLLVGTTQQLGVITDGVLTDVTPQRLISDTTVSFTTVSGSTEVDIDDPNTENLTTFDSVMIKTPVAVGGLILAGLHQIAVITGLSSYKINAATAATSSETNAGAVPEFTTTLSTSTVEVALVDHGLSTNNLIVFQVSTTGNGVTISGQYVATVVDADNLTIVANTQASSSGSFFMNSGNAEFDYYITIGPAAAGAGYGLGGYGDGGYGTGTTQPAQTGDPLMASDYTSDNWGEIALACPYGDGVYQYNPNGGFVNAGLVATAPPLNGGIFVSNALQILFCWGSTQQQSIGLIRDPMLIKWSDLGDYTNFVVSTTNQAGSFRIPIGSEIRGGMAVANQNLFWTDLDLWAANYAGFPLVFGFNKIGSGAGAISSHAMQQLRNGVYWMGPTNFYSYGSNGVSVIPCPVWDFVFQNLNTAYQTNVRAMPNTPFNEVGWLFPSNASTNGENDCYVKFNITEPNSPWDFGPTSALPRSAWIDQTVLGMPISAAPTGIIYQQETTPDADGQPMNVSFTTGYFFIAEGEDYAFVDQIIPDFKYGTYGGTSAAQIYLTILAVNYLSDTPQVYGPYLMSQTIDYLTVRIRARQMAFVFSSADSGSFWRIGKCRYRWAQAGRR